MLPGGPAFLYYLDRRAIWPVSTGVERPTGGRTAGRIPGRTQGGEPPVDTRSTMVDHFNLFYRKSYARAMALNIRPTYKQHYNLSAERRKIDERRQTGPRSCSSALGRFYIFAYLIMLFYAEPFMFNIPAPGVRLILRTIFYAPYACCVALLSILHTRA